MRSTRLLDEIEREAIDGDINKALRLCLSLGGKAGSTELRDWASGELNGYSNESIPEYRRIYAPLQVDGTTIRALVKHQTISPSQLPDFARDEVTEELELRQSLPGLVELIAAAKQSDESVRLMPPGASILVDYMNRTSGDFKYIESLYWSVSPSVIQEVVDRVRSNLVELVAEMRAGMTSGEVVPSPEVASQAISVVINGDKNRVKVKDAAKHVTEVPVEKTRLRRWLEVGAWVAGIGATVLLLILNWSELFG